MDNELELPSLNYWEQDARNAARAQKYLSGKVGQKVIAVSDKLVNFAAPSVDRDRPTSQTSNARSLKDDYLHALLPCYSATLPHLIYVALTQRIGVTRLPQSQDSAKVLPAHPEVA